MGLQQIRLDLLDQGKRLIPALDEAADFLAQMRNEQGVMSINAETAKDHMMKVHRQKTLEISLMPEIAEAKDPKTGRQNKDWTQYLIDEELEQDEQYISALGGMYEAQQQLQDASNNVLDAVERINVLKTQARLVSSMLTTVGVE